MAGAQGLEPWAYGFGDRRSTNWAIPLCEIIWKAAAWNNWWAFRDLNPGLSGYEPEALTNWAKGPFSVVVCTTRMVWYHHFPQMSRGNFRFFAKRTALRNGRAAEIRLAAEAAKLAEDLPDGAAIAAAGVAREEEHPADLLFRICLAMTGCIVTDL